MRRYASPFGPIELTNEREKHIIRFHPEVIPSSKYFYNLLAQPEIIRRSRRDPRVFILYRFISLWKKYLAIVIKTNRRKFILTAYLTHRIQHQPYE